MWFTMVEKEANAVEEEAVRQESQLSQYDCHYQNMIHLVV